MSLGCFLNAIPKNKSVIGDAETRRWRLIKFRSHFTTDETKLSNDYTYLADPSKDSEDYFESIKSAFIKYLQPYANKYLEDNKLDMPPTLKEELDKIFADNDPISSWMNERIQITNNKTDYLEIKVLHQLYKNDNEYENKKGDLKAFKSYIQNHHIWSLHFKDRLPYKDENGKTKEKGMGLKGISYIEKEKEITPPEKGTAKDLISQL